MKEDTYVQLNLPSKGLAYDKSVDLQKVMIRPFKGKEEQLIAELNISNFKKKFATILENVIKGIDIRTLTSDDSKHVMLWEAINSFNAEYPITLVCAGCEQEIKTVVNLGSINSVDLPDDFIQPFEVEVLGKKIQLRLPTVGDDIEVHEFGKKGQSTYLYSYAQCIVDDSTVLDRLNFLEELNTRELKKIKDKFKEFNHGPDMEVTYSCPLCDNEGKVVLPFRFETFFPVG